MSPHPPEIALPSSNPSDIDRRSVSIDILSPKLSFPLEPDTLVCTTIGVVEGLLPVAYVFHWASGWHFHAVGDRSLGTTSALLETLTNLDPSLLELGDLGLGLMAWRAEPGSPWRRQRR